MKNHKDLFEFICQLIDIQIKKYVALPKIGIGPDARLNAQLVFLEVNELLDFAEQLMLEMESAIQDKPTSPELFASIFEQVKFYIEQENLRAYAGWLLDENNIHTPLMDRVNEQIAQLKKLAQAANIEYSSSSKPVTEVQRQTENDSVAIAFYILDLAKKITENPEMELDESIPRHARVILQRNASTRYCREEFARPINELHKKCEEFLLESGHTKSDAGLDTVDAKLYEKQHKDRWSKLLARYKQIEPTADLFSPSYAWYKIGKSSEEKPKSSHSTRNFMLFGGVAAAGAVIVCMLIAYFSQQNNENSLNSFFKF